MKRYFSKNILFFALLLISFNSLFAEELKRYIWLSVPYTFTEREKYINEEEVCEYIESKEKDNQNTQKSIIQKCTKTPARYIPEKTSTKNLRVHVDCKDKTYDAKGDGRGWRKLVLQETVLNAAKEPCLRSGYVIDANNYVFNSETRNPIPQYSSIPKNFTYAYPYSIGSLEKLEKSAKGLGSISFLDQTDGIIRSLPLLVRFENKLYPTMGLEMIRVGSNQKNIYIEMNEIGINRISSRPHKIYSDPNGIVWIRYKKSLKSQYISASSVFDGKFDSARFKNKYVLIGASAQGLFDLVKTPLGVTIPGVEVHGNVIENILDQSYLVRNPNTYLFELLFSILVAVITFFLSQKIKPKYSLSIFFGSLVTVIIIGFSVFLFRSELVDISYPIFMLTVTFLTGLYFRFVEENRIALANLQKEAKLLKERELAGGVQKSLFPDISRFENFIYAKNVPARDVSGDYYDVVKVGKSEYFFTLADVSGKGIKAGMYMAKASSIFRTLSNLSYPLEKVVFGVNNELVEAKFKGMFVTAVFGKINIETGEVNFVNAGHESIMVFDTNKNFEFIKSEMPPIGIIKYFTESMVKSKTINLKEKTFVVYTDGVTEGYLKNGQELGAEGVQKIVTNLDTVTPKNLVDSIAKELDWGAEKLRDDITCLAINIKNTELIKPERKKIVEGEKKT